MEERRKAIVGEVKIGLNGEETRARLDWLGQYNVIT